MPNPIYTEIKLPAIVRKANRLAEESGFSLMPEGRPVGYQGPPSACIPQVGRLLQTLAAAKPGGLVGELGTGAGVGTAWLTSGLLSNARMVTTEINSKLADSVRVLFESYPQVEIRVGDWHKTIQNESFDLLFMDAAPRKDLEYANWDRMIEYVKVGGQIVMDDLIPVELWPVEWKDLVDYKREFALINPRAIGIEVHTTATTSAVIMTRVQ